MILRFYDVEARLWKRDLSNLIDFEFEMLILFVT